SGEKKKSKDGNDTSAGSPMENMSRLLLPLNNHVGLFSNAPVQHKSHSGYPSEVFTKPLNV
ncbi:MAG: hypothetical protein PV344_05915, partial [Anaplasma sp.]|nr:hypothetical protein [Anaplasma sp.]